MAAERVQALAASGLWEAINLPALREKPSEKPMAKPEGASTAVRLTWNCICLSFAEPHADATQGQIKQRHQRSRVSKGGDMIDWPVR